MNRKLIILGLDGANWTKLDEYASKGFMPHFTSIVKEGTRGTLQSNFPFTSGTAWTTIFTGANPGKHGIPHHLTEGKQELPSIWKILSNNSIKCIVVNDLITYPPLKINGIMISGGFSTPPTSKNYVHPQSLQEEIESLTGGYTPSLDKKALENAQQGNFEEFFNEVEEYGNKVVKTSIHLSKKNDWDVLSIMLENPDYIQHFFWDNKQFLERFYGWLDKVIKEFYDVGKSVNSNLLIISDHGFGPIKKHFLVNSWLEKEGFTKFEKPGKIRKTLSQTKVKRDFVRKKLSDLKIRKLASKLTPQSVKGMIPIEKEEFGFINSDTKIFSEAYNEITVKLDNHSDYDKIRNELITKLLEIEDEGKKVVLKAIKREDAFHGPFVNRAYDVQILLNEGYCWSPAIREKFLLTKSEFSKIRTGDHRPEGIFFACGPDIKQNYSLKDDLYTWDISPIILYILNNKIPKYMDGRVNIEIFNEKSSLAKGEMQFEENSEKVLQEETSKSYDKEEEAEIRKHLQDMGYI